MVECRPNARVDNFQSPRHVHLDIVYTIVIASAREVAALICVVFQRKVTVNTCSVHTVLWSQIIWL